MSSEINLKESYKMVVKKVLKDQNKSPVENEWVGLGSIKNINIGSTFQMIIPTDTKKAKMFSTLLIDDVLIISATEFQIVVEDGTVFRVEILDKVPEQFL